MGLPIEPGRGPVNSGCNAPGESVPGRAVAGVAARDSSSRMRKPGQFHAFQHVLNQVRLVRDPLLQMRSAEELLELRTQLKGAFGFGLRCRLVAELRMGHCRDKVRYPIVRHIDRLKNCQRLSVAPLAVFVEEEC